MLTAPRDPIVQALLCFFVPFYFIFWLYTFGKDLQQRTQVKVPSIWMLFGPVIIALVLFIGAFVSLIAFESKGSSVLAMVAIIIISWLVSIIAQVIYYWKFSIAAESVIGPDPDKLLVFIMFWLLSVVSVYLLEEALNKVIALPLQTAPHGRSPYHGAPGPHKQI